MPLEWWRRLEVDSIPIGGHHRVAHSGFGEPGSPSFGVNAQLTAKTTERLIVVQRRPELIWIALRARAEHVAADNKISLREDPGYDRGSHVYRRHVGEP